MVLHDFFFLPVWILESQIRFKNDFGRECVVVSAFPKLVEVQASQIHKWKVLHGCGEQSRVVAVGQAIFFNSFTFMQLVQVTSRIGEVGV